MRSPLLDAITPGGFDIGAGQVVLDGRHAQALVVAGYPPSAAAAWLTRLYLPGVTISVHATPADATTLVRQINVAVGELAARVGTARGELMRARAERALKDAQTLLRKIDQENQRVAGVVVVVLVVAEDAEELTRRVRQLEARASAAGMRLARCWAMQEPALRATTPACTLPTDIETIGARHMPSETIAAMMPWVKAGINRGRGVVLGRDDDGGLVLADLWQPPEGGTTNANMAILGASGAGKSYAVKVQLLRQYARGARIIAIDPEREYKDICEALGGTWVDAGGEGATLSPLRIPTRPKEEDGEDAGALAEHIAVVQTFFSLYLPDLTASERAALEDALLAVYAVAVVDWDTDPATVERWPEMSDLYEYIRAKGPERLAILLRGAAEGVDSRLWRGQGRDVGADSADVTVIDIRALSEAPEHVRRAQYFLALASAWALVRRSREEGRHAILVVDEAWLLADPATPQALDFLKAMSKRIRKYGPPPIGAGVWVATQQVSDFLADGVAAQGEAVLGNCDTKLLLRQGERDLERLIPLLRLSEAEQDLLISAPRGTGLLVLGRERTRLRVEAAAFEHRLITGGGGAGA